MVVYVDNLVGILDESARLRPDKIAVRYADSIYTYASLKARVDKLAGALTGLGVKKGDIVCVASKNTHASIEVLFACARIGAVCAQVNIRFSKQIVSALIKLSGASVVFAGRPSKADAGDACAIDGADERIVLIGEDDALGDGTCTLLPAGLEEHRGSAHLPLSYEELIRFGTPVDETAVVDPEDPALLLYTSGTTGLPKGVVLSHRALIARMRIDIDAMRFSSEDIFLCVLPLYHVTSTSALATLAVAGELVIAESSKPDCIAHDLVRFRATRTGLVPCLMRRLVEHVERTGQVFDALDLILYGGEPFSPELFARCRRAIPCNYLQGYGMTETAAAVTMLLPEHHLDARLLETVGAPVAGVRIKIVDQRGNELRAGQCGEVLVSSDALMSRYFGDPKHTAEAFLDGWYRTGDIGYKDEEGFLTLAGRKDHMIITGGENVYPLEVSRCIEGIAGVDDVAVVGIPDERWGEALAAFVVRASGHEVAEADIVGQCARELGSYKKPRIVRFVDRIERSDSGKVSSEQIDRLKALVRESE